MDIKQLRETVDRLFTDRSGFVNLCQEIAENFYPERAQFTVRKDLGEEFAGSLMTSYPLLCRRELGDQIGMMLRPTNKQWFNAGVTDESRVDNDAKRWLEWATGVQRRAMYDRMSLFTKATKQADHDYATFGQGPLSVRLNRKRDALLYRAWHIKDIVWQEDEEGNISLTALKWRPYAHDLVRTFGDKVHPTLRDKARRDPFHECCVYHIVCVQDMYDGEHPRKDVPYWSLYHDVEHDHLMEAGQQYNREYIIPRWQTVSGSQYAYSPAAMIALPEARLIQAMTYTLLEAGEKAVNPPLVAKHDVVRSDVDLRAGSITAIDSEYDERLGEVIRPLQSDYRNIPLGIDMQRDSRTMILQAFYLNKLTLPQRAPEMTAYEVGQRVQEYIRGALPLFEPMEADYNGQVCEVTFDLLLRSGAFGALDAMPRALSGADIHFTFISPLHDAIEQQKGQKWMEAKALVADAMTIDQSTIALLDAKAALRDTLNGIGVPAKWVRSETTVQQIEEAQQAAQESQQALAAMEQASNIAVNVGAASRDMAQVQAA